MSPILSRAVFSKGFGRLLGALPTYSVSPSASSLNEGSSVTFTVTTTNVPNGTTLYWSTNTVSGTVNASDFSDTANSGTVTINSNSGTIVRTLSNDVTTEGTEIFQLQIRTGSTSGEIVATSSNITINDTSLAPTYSVSPSATSRNEGLSVTFTVTTTNVTNGTVLYWTTNAVTGIVDSSDFTDAATSGTVTINSNSGTITRTLRSDGITEGSESFQLQIRTGSTSGTIVATSSTITINDTSTASNLAGILASRAYTELTPPTPMYSMVVFSSAIYYAYSPSSSTVYRSTDATSWTAYGTSGNFRYGLNAGGSYLHNFGGSNNSGINHTTNGTTWAASSVADDGSTTSYVVYNSARAEWIAGCGSWVSGTRVRKSTNGTSWTVTATFGGDGDTIVATSNTNTAYAYFAATTNSSSSNTFKAAISQDAATWTDTDLISKLGSSSPRFAFWLSNGYWYGNGAYNIGKSSSNGLVFTLQDKNALFLPSSPEVGGTIVHSSTTVAYISGNNEVSFTLDGTTWYRRTHTFGTLSNFCSFGGFVYAIGSGSNKYYRIPTT